MNKKKLLKQADYNFSAASAELRKKIPFLS